MSDNALTVSTTIIGLALNGIGLVFIGTQVVLARRQLRDNLTLSSNEATRIKRQATIDFYMTTVERVSEWRKALPNDWGKSAIDAYTSDAYGLKDKAKLQTLASYLGYFEALAVAVRSGIYDLVVLDSIAGSRIMNIAQNYQPFFVARRIEVGADTAYRSLEWLGDAIQNLRASGRRLGAPV